MGPEACKIWGSAIPRISSSASTGSSGLIRLRKVYNKVTGIDAKSWRNGLYGTPRFLMLENYDGVDGFTINMSWWTSIQKWGCVSLCCLKPQALQHGLYVCCCFFPAKRLETSFIRFHTWMFCYYILTSSPVNSSPKSFKPKSVSIRSSAFGKISSIKSLTTWVNRSYLHFSN